MQRRLLIGFLVVGVLVVWGGGYALTRFAPVQQNVVATSGAITGQVINIKGQPVGAAQVYADRVDSPMGRRLPFVLTDKEGAFLIKGLAPGIYTVSAAKEDDGYAPTDSLFHSIDLVAPPQVEVYERQTTSGVTLHLGPKATKLIGRIVDVITNKPIKDLQNIQIILRRVDAPDYSYMAGPDLEGNFSILIPSAPVTIEVSAPGYETKQLGALHLQPEESRRVDIPLRRTK